MSDHSGPEIPIGAEDYVDLVRSWVRRAGRYIAFPRKLKPRLVALHHILLGFEPGVIYTERQVNSTIQQGNFFAVDHVQIRRYPVDYGMLARKGDGSQYRAAHDYLALARWAPAISGTDSMQTQGTSR